MCNRERLRFGASVEGGPLAEKELLSVSTATGERPSFVLWFEDFHAQVPVAKIEASDRRGALPILTWEPWHTTLGSIADGAQDVQLIDWADTIKGCETRLYLRFAHEFNGDWYPWTSAWGTSPDQFRAAWRHIHTVFRRRGATNVDWLWCPNAVSVGDDELKAWYPGDDYVDVLAVDGYNWGNAKPAGEWIRPDELFDPALAEIRNLNAEKPILIAEVGCAEVGGSKAQWISDFVAHMAEQPDIDGFVWFEHDKETDWRLVSSKEATAAMACALEKRAAPCGVSP